MSKWQAATTGVKEEPFARKKRTVIIFHEIEHALLNEPVLKFMEGFFFPAFHLLTQVTAATGLWQQGQLHEAAELFRETIEGGES